MLKKTIICLALFFPFLVKADVVVPTITTFHFQQNSQPITESLSVDISCYGYQYSPGPNPGRAIGTYSEEKVFNLQFECPSYGCTNNEPYYLNYRQINFCLLEARTASGQIYQENIGNLPYGQCDNAGPDFDCLTEINFTANTASSVSQGSFLSLYQNNFYLALIITLISELLALYLLVKLAFKSIKTTNLRLIGAGAAASLLTLPIVWFIIPDLLERSLFLFFSSLENFYFYLVISEALAILLEAIIYRLIFRIRSSQALILSLICNVLSLAIGLILYYFIL